MYSSNSGQCDNDFLTFLRTILMILENHNFTNTISTFKEECIKLGYNINNSVTKASSNFSEWPMKIIFENLPDTQPYKIVIENKREEFSANNEIDENTGTTQQESNNCTASFDISKNNNFSLNKDDPITNTKNSIPQIFKNTSHGKEISGIKKVDNLDEKDNSNTNKKKTSTDLPAYTENETKSKNNHTEISEHDILKFKFSALQTEHQKLIDLVTDLTFALQTSIKGQPDHTRIILNNCEAKYPELFCEKPKNTRNKEPRRIKQQHSNESNKEEDTPGVEINTDSSKYINNDLKLPVIEINNPYISCFHLNYYKIKYELLHGDLDTKLLLLQALRWRITKTSVFVREEILQEYKYYDLLNIHNCQSDSEATLTQQKNSIMFTSFFSSSRSSQILQQSISRFINAIASFNIGRDYITHNSLVLNILLPILFDTNCYLTKMDYITQNMIIATLQKISLRYSQRTIMINEGVTEHMVKFLTKNLVSINEYCLEYSIALLRNLWLHSKARDNCRLIAKDVMSLLMNLLNEQYCFCLPYIQGALYYLLSDNYYYNAAKDVHFEELLEKYIKDSEVKFKEELKYILDMYSNFENSEPLCECNLSNDTDSNISVLEPEIDENEPNQQNSGEYFLENYRLIYSFHDTNTYTSHINSIYSKPVTPNYINTYNSTLHADKINAIPEIQCLEYAAQFLSDRMNEKVLSIANQVEYTQIHVKEHQNTTQNENVNSNTNVEVEAETVERTFCEETQQYYYTPTKNRIFESQNSKNLYMLPPSFIKSVGNYDLRNISKSLPISPRNNNMESSPSSAKSTRTTRQYLSPTNGLCYRETFKTRSYSDSSTPHIGFCDENAKTNNIYVNNKYSCSCFTEIQRSFEEEAKRFSHKNSEKNNNFAFKAEHRHTGTNKVCKYKCYPTSNSAPLQTSPKKEKDSGSKSLDENDYSSVFESRPRILRTP